MRILVLGATGTIGRRVLPLLVQSGAAVTGVTRDLDRARGLAAGVEWVTGDLLDPIRLQPAFATVDRLFLLLAGQPEEAHCGFTAIALAKASRVSRIVYLSVHQTSTLPRLLPHIAAKLAIEDALAGCGIPYNVLRANTFFQNDFWYKRALIRDHVYPQPLGPIGVSSCDAQDIAEAAAHLLVKDGLDGQIYDLVGPDIITSEIAARHWSMALDAPIRVPPWDPEAWQVTQIAGGISPWLIHELRLMYEDWQINGFLARQADVDRLARLLGRPPAGYGHFVRKTALAWRAAASDPKAQRPA